MYINFKKKIIKNIYKKNFKKIYICPSSKSVTRVGPVSVWVHVSYGVTDYVCYGIMNYVHNI